MAHVIKIMSHIFQKNRQNEITGSGVKVDNLRDKLLSSCIFRHKFVTDFVFFRFLFCLKGMEVAVRSPLYLVLGVANW